MKTVRINYLSLLIWSCAIMLMVKLIFFTNAANTKISSMSWLIDILPIAIATLIIISAFSFYIRMLINSMQNSMQNSENQQMKFKKAPVSTPSLNEKKVTFEDVAGAEEEKEELKEITEFLKDPTRYSKLGARIPKGVLLIGPPGTGKTLLAKAVAGEANVPFYSISGSDFVEMFVGVGASRVRDLFETAKKSSPSIVFIDEIDAVGRHRGAGMGGGNDEREQTLNQLLVEMDGFGENSGVIIIAATNRPDILDPALLRPGRFDRQVMIGLPDVKGREDILKIHAANKPLGDDVKLNDIAKTTVGFTGADLENLLNESALLAARKGSENISMQEIDESVFRVIVGTEKKTRQISEKEKKLTAYHEAGHAVTNFYLDHIDPVHQISIIPRGMAGGFTMSMPKEDKSYISRKDMLDQLVTLLGGRVAESIVLGDISTGASNDIERATDIAKKMITKYGMSSIIGPISYSSPEENNYIGSRFSDNFSCSETKATEIDSEISSIIKEAYKRAELILSSHLDKLDSLANALIAYEKIDSDQFNKIMAQSC